MNKIIEANETNFVAEVLEAKAPVVVDFYAHWCGPCKMLAPLLEEFAVDFGTIKFVKLNVDDAPQLCQDFQITGVPTLILFRGGKAVDTIVGFPAPQKLKARLQKFAGEGIAV